MESSNQRVALMLLGLMTLLAASHGAETGADGVEFFEKRIRPIFAEHCYECHSKEAKKLKGKLWLDSKEGIQRGGESGPAVVAGKPEEKP